MRIIRVSSEALLAEWTKDEPRNNELTDEGRQAMERIHDAMLQLRKCVSEVALQKACLRVSLDMLELLKSGQAGNPFVCMQHAAMFAYQCSKGGTNDRPFKTVLPPERECTPQQALLVLARCDCLQGLDFVDEAIFLCNYVARVCQLHRDKLEKDLEWSSKWKVVGIVAFNTSMAIRSTIFTTLRKGVHEQQKLLDDWDVDVVAELERCRNDAIVVKRLHASIDTPEDEVLEDDEDDPRDDIENPAEIQLPEVAMTENEELIDEGTMSNLATPHWEVAHESEEVIPV